MRTNGTQTKKNRLIDSAEAPRIDKQDGVFLSGFIEKNRLQRSKW